MYENIETIKETIEIIKIKKAARLSILKVSERKGIFVSKLKVNEISFKNNNLYIITILKNPLETKASVFDNLFDNLGTEYVSNEDSAPIKYNTTHIIKYSIRLFAVMN